MKVNLGVEINDVDRNTLAQYIDGKQGKRLATRDEVREFLVATIESLASGAQEHPPDPETVRRLAATLPAPLAGDLRRAELLRVDEEDAQELAGKDPSYIVGWNRWKRRTAK